MCLIKTNPNNLPLEQLIKIAQNDIYCHKMVIPSKIEGIFLSLPQLFPYRVGRTVKVKLTMRKYAEIIGFYTFKNTSEEPNIFYGNYIMEALIPKGSEIVYADNGYITSVLIPQKFTKINNERANKHIWTDSYIQKLIKEFHKECGTWQHLIY